MFSPLVISILSYLLTVNFKLSGDNLVLRLLMTNYTMSNQFEQQVIIAARQASQNFLPLGAEARQIAPRLPEVAKKIDLTPVKIASTTAATTTEFELEADSGVVLDCETGAVLYEKNSDQPKPIASITKLMTAMVFIEHNPGWDTIYELKAADKREGSIPYVGVGEKVKVKDLFYLSLVASGNTETMALVGATGLTEAQFVDQMNIKADFLGLSDTEFGEPVGLDKANVSTAYEVAKITQAALSIKEIREATMTKHYEFTSESGSKIKVDSTDKLLKTFDSAGNGVKIAGGKTGFTEEAGGCFASKFIDAEGHEVVSVVLGGSDRSSRFTQTRGLIEWIFSNFHWPR